MGKRKIAKSSFTEQELSKISGGMPTHGAEGVHVPRPIQAPAPIERVAAKHAGPADAPKDSFARAPIPGSKFAPPVEVAARAVKGLFQRLALLDLPNEHFASADDVDAHRRKLSSFEHLLDRQAQLATGKDAQNQISDLRKQHNAISLRLGAHRDSLRVKDCSEAVQQLQTTGLNPGSLAAIGRAFDVFRVEVIPRLSKEHRAEFDTLREAAVKELRRLSMKQDASKDVNAYQELASRLASDLDGTTPQKGVGPRLRFEQARYKLGAAHSGTAVMKFARVAIAKHKEIIREGLKNQTPASAASLKEFEALSASVDKVRNTDKERVVKEKSQYPNMFLNNTQPESLIASNISLLASRNLRPLSTATFRNENLYQAVSHLATLAERPGVYMFRIPSHTMAIHTDPASNTYRFFDPNLGLMTYHDRQEFIDDVIRTVNGLYNESQYSPYKHNAASGPKHPGPPKAGGTARREIQLLDLGAGHSVLGLGICNAMSTHVAHWFLTHPGHTGTITAEMLGLQAFDTAIAATAAPSKLSASQLATPEEQASPAAAPAQTNFSLQFEQLALRSR